MLRIYHGVPQIKRVPTYKNMTIDKYLSKIGLYWYKKNCISNTILNLHFTLMSSDCTIFRNYFCIQCRPSINKCIELKLPQENVSHATYIPMRELLGRLALGRRQDQWGKKLVRLQIPLGILCISVSL